MKLDKSKKSHSITVLFVVSTMFLRKCAGTGGGTRDLQCIPGGDEVKKHSSPEFSKFYYLETNKKTVVLWLCFSNKCIKLLECKSTELILLERPYEYIKIHKQLSLYYPTIIWTAIVFIHCICSRVCAYPSPET